MDRFTLTDDTGREYIATVEHDEHMGAPWDEHDGHGPVTGWECRDKAPGEFVLEGDGRGYCGTDSARRFYDFAEACKIAQREGWAASTVDAELCRLGSITKAENAARAARADFERLRAWCNDDWCWVCVTVRPADACPACGPSASLSGIESDCGDYIREVANDLVNELEV